MNLDPIQTGKVLILAFEGKSESDSNPIVLLDGISSPAKDNQSRKRSRPTPASKVRFSNSLDTEFRSKERDMRLRSSLAKIIKYPPLPPRPGIIPVPRPSLKYFNTSWLPKEIGNLLKIKETFFQPKFKFTISEEAATYNYNLLKNSGFDLNKLLNPGKTCCTSYGSEMKSTEKLEKLLGKHPRWNILKEKLSYGCEYPVKDLDEEVRLLDLKENLNRGNHKSAKRNEEHLGKAMMKEIKKGWGLILPEDSVLKIPNLELAPMGVAEHLGINSLGEYITKQRVTHDFSFPGIKSKESINSRMDKSKLEPVMFGHCLLRLIHQIVSLRKRHPNKKIWIRKEDLKSAYRRLHLRASSALKSAVRVKMHKVWYIILSLRITFGGTSGPADFCLFSDILCDTINDLLACKSWDEKQICSDFTKNIPPAENMNNNIPFAKASELSVDIPIEDTGKFDVYIDDFIGIKVDIANNKSRLEVAPCTVIQKVSNNPTSENHIPRDNMIEIDKCIAEGAIAEERICIGWILNTRELLVKLPEHKCKAWITDLENFIKRISVNHNDLKSLIGKLENVIIITKMQGHFMNNLYALEMKSSETKHNIKVTRNARKDAELHIHFLEKARLGINMNLLTFRKPTYTTIGDACEHGLGAFNVETGIAWTYEIPFILRGRAHINLLEFITQVVSIWFDFIEGRIKKGDCLLAMGDNTASMGWLRRSNFREENESNLEWFAKQEVARKLARIVLLAEACLYSQWFAGEKNIGGDIF